ncbi:MAG: LTA synthase family protein [Lachnospiraceae bacterium]|nr:LTA synthase family protein [Lachnospiraceae bacterium]
MVIFMEKIKAYILDIFKDKVKRLTFILFVTLPIFVNLIIELLSRKSVIKLVSYIFGNPLAFLSGVAIIMATMSIMLLFKRRFFVMVVVAVIWTGFGVTNFVLRSFRETPFSASDFRLIGDAMKTIDKYMNFVGILMLCAGIVLVIAIVVFLFIKSPQYGAKINYVRNLIYISVIIMVTAAEIKLSIATGALSLKFSNITEAYFNYGFVYGFSTSLVNTGIKKPSDYNDISVETIVDKVFGENTVDNENVKTPNIIFLQLESFFDVNKVIGLELSQDPTPNFNKMKAEYPSGYLSVNNVGYGTANTEFEVITGINLDDFGPGEFPYKTILTTTTCESVPFNLKEHGYVSHAMHNNVSTFYQRSEIFPKLGFDNFTSLESMLVEEFTEIGWAKDKYLKDEILKLLDSSDGQDYIYTIAVQSHGTYPSTPVLDNPLITVSGIDEERKYSFEYYVNLLYEVDLFVKELTDALSEREEETILVMYGDHLPSLGLTEEEIENGDLYQTEYIIWNNFGLKLEDMDLETFQLSSRVLQSINIDTGIINKFHQVYGDEDEEEYLRALHVLEYDILYGKKYVYDGINPYIETEMTLGVDEISIESVRKFDGITVEPEDDYYIIEGEHFTSYCNVIVNGEAVETEFISSNRLKIPYIALQSMDSIVVRLEYEDNILKESDEFIYIENSNE